jgi:hypothetical protein
MVYQKFTAYLRAVENGNIYIYLLVIVKEAGEKEKNYKREKGRARMR